ncbi:MAG: hypothetical protein ABW072_09690 [Sedimenticola sp.]
MKKQLMFLCGILLLAFSASSRAIPIPVALDVTPTPLGEGWRQTVSGGFIPTYSLVPVGEHSVTISFDDGSQAIFDFSVTPSSQALVPIQFLNGAVFTPRSGTTGTLTANDSADIYIGGAPGVGDIYNLSLELYDPSQYRYTFITGEQILLDRNVIPPSQAPEPVPLLLIGIGLVSIGFARKKKAA